MKILMVASEATPFAKTGGLADVLGSLPPALVRAGDEVAVVLPKYRVTETGDAQAVYLAMPLWVGPHAYRVDILQSIHRGAFDRWQSTWSASRACAVLRRRWSTVGMASRYTTSRNSSIVI